MSKIQITRSEFFFVVFFSIFAGCAGGTTLRSNAGASAPAPQPPKVEITTGQARVRCQLRPEVQKRCFYSWQKSDGTTTETCHLRVPVVYTGDGCQVSWEKKIERTTKYWLYSPQHVRYFQRSSTRCRRAAQEDQGKYQDCIRQTIQPYF